MTVTSIAAKATEQEAELFKQLRKAVKDGAPVEALVKGAFGLFGDPKAACDDTAKGEDLITQGRALVQANESHALAWFKVATLVESSTTGAKFAEATGNTDANRLGRLVRAGAIFDAAKTNKTPITAGRAWTMASKSLKSEALGIIVAYNESPEGVDPFATEVASVAGKAPAVPTVEAYVKAVEALSKRLSGLLTDGFPAPKAETLEALKAAAPAFDRMARQHKTLTESVAAKGKTPAAKPAKARKAG